MHAGGNYFRQGCGKQEMQRGEKKTPVKQTNQLTLIQALYEIRYLTKSIFEDQMMCILTVADLPHVKQQKVLID